MKGYGSLLSGAAIGGLVVLTALVAVPAVGSRTAFYTRGEPREALVVQTIARGDGFVLPMRNGNELPSKPPLFHWLGALASVAKGHVDEAAVRLPSLVAALVTVVASAAAAWAWWGPAAAALTAIILSTSFQWIASSVTGRVDMLLAATITLALLLFARAIETGRRIPALAFVLLTAATLTKGPVGLILPCTIALVTLVVRGELRFLGSRDLRLLGLATAAASIWYVAAFAVGGEAFFAKQILKENVFRVLDPDSVEAGHVAPLWFYVPLLAAGLAPWSLFLPGLAAFALTRPQPAEAPVERDAASPETPQAPAPPATIHGRLRRLDPQIVFALVWATVTFVLFSVAGSKRAVYLLPAFPAFAMLVSAAWVRVVRERPQPLAAVLLLAGSVLGAVLMTAIAVIVLAGSSGIALDGWLRGFVSHADVNNVSPMMEATREHRAVVIPCCLAMLAASWITIRSARSGRWARVIAATAVAMLALSTTVSTTLLPALASKRSTRSLMQHVEQLVPAGSPLSFYRSFDYGAVFYRSAPIPVRQALADVPEIDGAWLLTQPALLPDLAEEVRQLDTGGEAAGAYEVHEVFPSAVEANASNMEALASADVDSSDRSSLILVRIGRRIGDEHSDGN